MCTANGGHAAFGAWRAARGAGGGQRCKPRARVDTACNWRCAAIRPSLTAPPRPAPDMGLVAALDALPACWVVAFLVLFFILSVGVALVWRASLAERAELRAERAMLALLAEETSAPAETPPPGLSGGSALRAPRHARYTAALASRRRSVAAPRRTSADPSPPSAARPLRHRVAVAPEAKKPPPSSPALNCRSVTHLFRCSLVGEERGPLARFPLTYEGHLASEKAREARAERLRDAILVPRGRRGGKRIGRALAKARCRGKRKRPNASASWHVSDFPMRSRRLPIVATRARRAAGCARRQPCARR